MRDRRPQNRQSDAVQLAGWLFADLFVLLFVVGIAGMVMQKPAASQSGPTTSTSTTTSTQPPVPLCRSLYSSPGVKKRGDGIYFEMRMTSPVTEESAEQFRVLFQEQIDEEARNFPDSVLAGRSASEIHIGLVLASGGAGNSQNVGPALAEASAFVEGLRTLLPEILAASDSYSEAIVRPGGTVSVPAGYVGLDIFPYVESPCFE